MKPFDILSTIWGLDFENAPIASGIAFIINVSKIETELLDSGITCYDTEEELESRTQYELPRELSDKQATGNRYHIVNYLFEEEFIPSGNYRSDLGNVVGEIQYNKVCDYLKFTNL